MNDKYWLSDISMREAVFTRIYNKVEKSNIDFELSKMEENIVKGFINGLCN